MWQYLATPQSFADIRDMQQVPLTPTTAKTLTLREELACADPLTWDGAVSGKTKEWRLGRGSRHLKQVFTAQSDEAACDKKSDTRLRRPRI